MNDFTQSLVTLSGITDAAKNLMKTPFYKRIGEEGICAILGKAKSLNVDPVDALNGGLYCVQGKVEMSSAMMNQLIRQQGHSIRKDEKSNDTICILHGKRADNGDTWTESFSIDEAKKAGVYKEGGPWSKYPRDMLFARALSRLARQLFPDVIKGCYTQGEISNDETPETPTENKVAPLAIEKTEAKVTEEQELQLLVALEHTNLTTVGLLRRLGLESLKDLEASRFDGCLNWLNSKKVAVEGDEHEDN